MDNNTLFCHLSSTRIAEMIRSAKHSVCYAGPGIQTEPADSMVKVAERLGPEMLTVCIDFDERVMRMGYGDIDAVRRLREVGVIVNHSPGLRSALLTVDGDGYIYTPTALYLEAESENDCALNALRLSHEQAVEAQARLSPVAKEIAVAMATTSEKKRRIAELPLQVDSIQVRNERFNQVDNNLKTAPPVKFDIARQVQVFQPYIQYVELSLSGAAIQRHRLAIPPSILKLGGSTDLEGRLRTTFELIERNSKLSSKALENQLNEIRKYLTPSLGKVHGRVVLKSVKPYLNKRLKEFREKLDVYKENVKEKLQQHLDSSQQQIVDYYLPIAIKTPPDALIGQSLNGKPSDEDVGQWLNSELERCFPKAESLIKEIKLEVRFKDVTFETLNQMDFLNSIKNVFPNVDWDKAYREFKAVGETK